MKAIDPVVFESAVDLGAGWWPQTKKILIPLAAPGIFIAMILVYIPMLTDFVTSGHRGRRRVVHDGAAGPGPDSADGRLGRQPTLGIYKAEQARLLYTSCF